MSNTTHQQRRLSTPRNRHPLPYTSLTTTTTTTHASAKSPRSRNTTKRPSTAPGNVTPRTIRPTTAGKKPLTATPKKSATNPPKAQPTTTVVLPPRSLSSTSSTNLLTDNNNTLTIPSLHYAYTAHKGHWVKSALENLGSSWIREGKITAEQLVSGEFEEKIAVLYDLAMVKKNDAIDMLVDEVIREEVCKIQDDGSNTELNPNFPFASRFSKTMREKMSSSLLGICVHGGKQEAETREQSTVGGGDINVKGDGVNKKKSSKEDDNSFDNSANGNMKKPYNRRIAQCYVVDGGKLVIGTKNLLGNVGGSFVHRFGPSYDSRARKPPVSASSPQSCIKRNNNNEEYYRRTVNMIGFNPHEVKIRWCKDTRQIIVNGSRPQRIESGENERQVREVIYLPKGLEIGDLVVMRTAKGSLIFEEMEEEK